MVRPPWRLAAGRPDPEQFRAVLGRIVGAAEPDVVVAFGSAVRGEMRPHSDVDLFVLKDLPNESKVRQVLSDRLPWEVLRNLPPVDLVPGAVCRVPVYHDALAMVYHDALKRGIVVYNRRAPEQFEPASVRDVLGTAVTESREMMVRRVQHHRDEALEWLEEAEESLQVVNIRANPVKQRCIAAQASSEKSLKSLLVAHGRPVPYLHGLAELAHDVGQCGESIPGVATEKVLKELSAYGGDAQYPGWEEPENPEPSERYIDAANALYRTAAQRVPEILNAREATVRESKGR